MKKIQTIFAVLLLFTSTIYADSIIKVAALKGPTGLSMVNLIHGKIDLGSKTEYSVVNTPQLVTAGLLSGTYDIAALPTNLAAIIYNKKPDYTLAAITGAGTLYVLSSRDDIKSWADLKDKKVYNIARSSTPGFLFNYLLGQNNIDPKTDIDIDFTFNHVELAPMLIAGKVETGILPEPLITNVLLKNKDMKVVLDFQKEYEKGHGASYPLSCVVIKKSLIKENPEAVKKFLMELEKSINWVVSNPMDAGNKGKEIGLGVTGPLITKAIDRLNLGFKNAKDAENELSSYYSVLFKSDPRSIGGSMPDKGFYLDAE